MDKKELQSPLVSIVITTKNEELVIGNLLASIKKQEYRKVEIIVIDNNSSDRTKAIAKKYTGQVYNKGPERSTQRNFGASLSQGEYILFLDADMELTKRVVCSCVDRFETGGKRAKPLGGIIIPEESFGEGYWAKVKSFERSFYVGDDTVESARFYLKDAFEKVGGFDENLLGFEDLDLTERVREFYDIERVSEFIRHNEKKPTLLGLAKKSSYYAVKTSLLLEKHKISPLSPRTIYFLRPVFYKKWKRLLTHPILSLSMMFMFTVQLVYGGFSYLKNRH